MNASLSNSQANLPSIPTYEWHALGDDRRRLPLHHLACREARRRERAMTMPAPEATSTARAACGRGTSPVFAKLSDPGSPSAEGTGSSVTVTHACPLSPKSSHGPQDQKRRQRPKPTCRRSRPKALRDRAFGSHRVPKLPSRHNASPRPSR